MSDIVIKKVSEIKVIETLYPRGDEKDTKLIQRYATDLEVLPPIEINQNNILIDGFHRLSAHKQLKKEEVPCIITTTNTDDDLFWLAVRKNNSHGWQLSIENKKRIAVEKCGGVHDDEYIIKELSIGVSTFNSWTKNKREQLDKDRDAKIWDLYLQCRTQEEIAERFDISQKTVSNRIDILSKSAIDSKITKDFTPQIYNVWNFARNNNETKHFGNVPTEITENLLYAYTEPFDVVFDPFGGGGATIDACKKWNRRYFVNDIQPSEIAIQKGMRTHDITTGLPEGLPRPKLVFLDPPYWRQAKGQYTDKPTDLSNMELPEFYKQFEGLFKLLKSKIVDGGYLAFIIQNTQWLNDNKKTEPHSHKIWNLAEKTGFEFETIIHVPYSTEQYNAQQVNYAKEHKIFLELNRELIVLTKN
jgi:DNA modification methylase